MTVRINEPVNHGLIVVDAIEDGQIVVIVKSSVENQIGLTMCRCGDCFCQIGGGDTWWTEIKEVNDTIRVRVLPNGTALIVEDNE